MGRRPELCCPTWGLGRESGGCSVIPTQGEGRSATLGPQTQAVVIYGSKEGKSVGRGAQRFLMKTPVKNT